MTRSYLAKKWGPLPERKAKSMGCSMKDVPSDTERLYKEI
jgi:hypothetical protein